MDVGVEINHYKIIEHIGRGGMADVWSARDNKLNRMVAIKTIAHGLAVDSNPVGMFKQEAQTIAQMEHPHILPIYDFGDYEGQLYIVMRYVAGGSLEDLLRRGPLPINEALRMGQAIAQALDYAHKQKVVHLDLKPPNVLLDSSQSPYLADFGLATVLDREGKATNPGSGTLLYMAPEQLTSEVIDWRADLYSFAVVMFHMLTGVLPFDATPIALKQMQYHQELPTLDEINPLVPPSFTDILRRATAVDPDDRYSSLVEVVDEMRLALNATEFGGVLGSGTNEYTPPVMDLSHFDSEDAGILEAVDIFSRARHNWAGGNGRFLLGVTNFMLMNGYYMSAEAYKLDLDEAGTQMLLRGALEYDQEVDFWWNKLDDENRRWVCLHALRSGNAPARVRALYRIETLSDSERPQIPKLVAQALQVETNEAARLAALQVLATRAKVMSKQKKFDVKTEYRGRMLTMNTREGIQEINMMEWQETVFSEDIDTLIAEIAVDYGMPKVAESAARVVGRIRSITAVRHIAQAQREGRHGALRALALVRDEAPSLPHGVSIGGRIYAWMTNTLRRMSDVPLSLIFRYFMAAIGGWLAMGLTIWITYRNELIFTPQRWSNSLAVGLIFGLFIGFLVLFTDEFISRLRGFWRWWMRLIVSFGLGWAIGILVWTQYTWLFLQQPEISTTVMRFGGFGLMLGFFLTTMLKLRSFLSIPLTALFTYIPIYVTYQIHYMFETVPFFSGLSESSYPTYSSQPIFNLGRLGDVQWFTTETIFPFKIDWALIFYDFPDQVVSVGLMFAIILAVGAHFPSLLHDIRALIRFVTHLRTRPMHPQQPMLVPAVATPTLAPKPAIAPVGNLKTEMDVNLGKGDDEDDDAPETEMDVQMRPIGYSVAGDTLPLSEVPPVDILKSTEMDVNLGLQKPLEDSMPTKPPVNTGARVNIKTGIKIDNSPPPPNQNTELDVNKGKKDDD
jgi:serine/threonine-protein kinase